MLISSSLLNWSLKNQQRHNNLREDYNNNNTLDSISLGIDNAFAIFFIIISVILFIAEFIILLFLISNAIVCTQPGAERTLHIVLIIFFTYPYALLVAFFGNGCMKGRLQTNTLFES